MIVGLDTGFFVKLVQEKPAAMAAWDQVERSELSAVISCVSLFELERFGLRGSVPKEVAEKLVLRLPNVCTTVWLDNPAILLRAARTAHGRGLSMADAMIVTSLVEAGADEVYTTDRDFLRWTGGPTIVVL